MTSDSQDPTKKYGRNKRTLKPNPKYRDGYDPDDRITDSENAEESEESEFDESPPKRVRKEQYFVAKTSVTIANGNCENHFYYSKKFAHFLQFCI